mgnify:CR=1 FL=1
MDGQVVRTDDAQRYARVSVLTYLGEDRYGDHQFNARPLAGTTMLRASSIVSVEEVAAESAGVDLVGVDG